MTASSHIHKLIAFGLIIAAMSASSSAEEPKGTGGVFGLGGKSEIRDIVTAPDGDILVCGILDDNAAPPANIQPQLLLHGDFKSGRRGFLARFSPEIDTLKWFSLLPANVFEPTRMAVAEDSSVCLGGRKLPLLPDNDKAERNWSKTDGALIRISPNGTNILWISPAGPNQSAVTGLAVEGMKRVYFTAPSRQRGAANYVLRKTLSDGSNEEWGKTGWCVYLHQNAEALKAPGQFIAFYDKAKTNKDGFDYDGAKGWGEIRFRLHGFSCGGQVVVLPDGDIAVSSGLQYDFAVKGKRFYPAFDVFVARYGPDGTLRWSTNLYQDGDSVHAPDQKPVDLAYDPATDRIYVLAKQHGSNVYRFKGPLKGDTGNLMISWLGQVNAKTGELISGWYFQNNRHGKFGANGMPAGPPHPKLAGNAIRRIKVDTDGNILLAGQGAAKTWTSENAWQSWPGEQAGGSQPALVLLKPDMTTVPFASCFFVDAGEPARINALEVTAEGIVLGGKAVFAGEMTNSLKAASWSQPGTSSGCALWIFPLPKD